MTIKSFKPRTDTTIRSLLSASASKPIQIKKDNILLSHGHHYVPNHLCSQDNYLDASCLTKSKLNMVLNQETSTKPLNTPFKSFKLLDWSWSHDANNCNQESPPLLLSQDQKSVCFHPYCMGCFETNAIQGNKALKLNSYTYWEVSLSEGICAGTSVMIGIGRRNSKLNTNGYVNLIGADCQSWGLSNKGQIWHDGKSRIYCQEFDSLEKVKIGCLFDGYSGKLSFFKNGQFLGTAFESLGELRNQQGLYDLEHELFPMVSSTVSKSLIRLEFVCENFASLKEMCRERVQQEIMIRSDFSQEEQSGELENFYQSFLYRKTTLSTDLPQTIVEYLMNK